MNPNIKKIDKTSLKFNQACIVLFTALSFLLNTPWIAALVGIIMLLDTLIPGTGLFKLFYKNIVKPLQLLKPHIVEESSSPHRFAQGLGGSFLLLSFILLQYTGLIFLGWALSFIVIALAFINLTLDFCAGCFIYFQLQKLKFSSTSSITGNKNA